MTGTILKQALVVTGVSGTFAVMVWWGLASGAIIGAPQQSDASKPPVQTAPETPVGNVALRYATAVQQGNCHEVLRQTLWINERLNRVRRESGEEAADEVREELCARVQKRSVEHNVLRLEGVKDQYIFAPGAQFELVQIDEGAPDLERPVKERTWIRVTYPYRERALRDMAGNPIRALTVGVNISHDGYVLKAGVIGNLQIDRTTVCFDWERLEGG